MATKGRGIQPQGDSIIKAEHVSTGEIGRSQIDPSRNGQVLRSVEIGCYRDKIGVPVETQYFTTLGIVNGRCLSTESSMLSCPGTLVVRRAIIKRVVTVQIRRQRCRHVQRHAAIEIGVRRERHVVQGRIDIGLGAVDHEIAAAVGTFDEGKARSSR